MSCHCYLYIRTGRKLDIIWESIQQGAMKGTRDGAVGLTEESCGGGEGWWREVGTYVCRCSGPGWGLRSERGSGRRAEENAEAKAGKGGGQGYSEDSIDFAESSVHVKHRAAVAIHERAESSRCGMELHLASLSLEALAGQARARMEGQRSS